MAVTNNKKNISEMTMEELTEGLNTNSVLMQNYDREWNIIPLGAFATRALVFQIEIIKRLLIKDNK